MTNRYGISVPARRLDSLQRVTSQLKEAVEAVLGYRGSLYSGGPEVSNFESLLAKIEDHERRIADLESEVSFLFDWVYANGYIDPTPLYWAPGVTTPTAITRVPINTIAHISNLSHPDDYGFVPLYDADYLLVIGIRFEPDQNNRVWNVGLFDNGVQVGDGVTFNSRDLPVLDLNATIGVPLDAGDVLDVRLWSDTASSTGDILGFTYDMSARGVRAEDARNR